MKRIILFLALVAAYCSASAQGGYIPSGTKINYVNGIKTSRIIFTGDTLSTAEPGSFAMISGVLYYKDSTAWKTAIGTGTWNISTVGSKNGISLESDSLRLGGELSDSITHFKIGVDAQTTQSVLRKVPVLVYSNRTIEQDLILSDWRYWRERGGNALSWYQRLFNETDNDTAAQQYNGIINSFNRITQDFSSNRFNYSAGGKATPLQYNGVYSIAQLYPVRSTLIQPGWFGADGAVFAGAWGFGGRDSAYDITVQASTTAPVPISIFKADIDLNRAVNSSRSRTMTGIGVSGYTAGFRSYQSSQGTANTSNPSFIENVTQFTAIGSLEESPFSGQGLSKTDILARSEIRNAYGIHFQPQRGMENEVNNGFPIWQQGAHDFNYFEGKIRLRGSKPDRSAGDTMSQELEVYGNTLLQGSNNLRFRGSSTGTFPGMYWLLAPDTAGSQASIDFNANASRDSRALIIGVGTSATATSGYSSNDGLGWRYEVRTGLNGINRMVMWRNGNVTIAPGSTAGDFKDSARLAVDGTGYFDDKVKLVAPIDSDSSNYAVTSAWVKRNSGTGSGSSTNLANTDLTQTAEPRIFDHNGLDFQWTDNGETRWYGYGGYSSERIMIVDGKVGRWYGGRIGTGVYFEAGDSLYGRGVASVSDTANKFVLLQTSNDGFQKVRAGAFAGGGGSTDGWLRAVVTTDFGLSDVNTAQTAFPSAIDQVTLESNSTYYFEFAFDMSVGNSSHATGMGFDLGSTTLNRFNMQVMGYPAVANNVTSLQTTSWWTSTTPNSAMMAASAVTGNHLRGWGYMSVDTGGDVTPQIIFSAAPGGTNLMKAGSYIHFRKVGDGSFTTNQGFK